MTEELDHWEAIAREHGGVPAFIFGSEIDGEEALEGAILTMKSTMEGAGAVTLRLFDGEGTERISFLVRRDHFDVAIAESDQADPEDPA